MTADTLTVTGLTVGTATVVVTASDGYGGTATQNIAVTVTNTGPMTVGTIGAVTLKANQMTDAMDVSGYFSDEDSSDTLTYTAESGDDMVATANIPEGSSMLTITGVAIGMTNVTSDRQRRHGDRHADYHAVTVENRAPETVGALSAVTLKAGVSVTVGVATAFTDGDGDELTYSAESGDDMIASVTV